MLKINGIDTNYSNLFIYENGSVIYSTCRPYGLDLIIDGLTIRNARKTNLKKNDCFEVKAEPERYSFRNGKNLYIPSAVISVKSVTEEKAFATDGATNYKNVYVLSLNCNASRYNKHFEKVTDLPGNMPLIEYDKNGVFASHYLINKNTYDTGTNYETGEKYIVKRWLTLDKMEEITVESDFYTRTEKTNDRLEREKLAEIITGCLFSNKPVSHYEVAKMLEKLNISIKE